MVERANQARAYLLASERRRALLYGISTAVLVANALLIFAFAPYSQGMGIVILGASLALDLTILFEVRHGSSRIVTDPSRVARASRASRASISSRWLLCRCDVAPPLHHLCTSHLCTSHLAPLHLALARFDGGGLISAELAIALHDVAWRGHDVA